MRASAHARSGSGRRSRGSRSPSARCSADSSSALAGWRGIFWFNLGFGAARARRRRPGRSRRAPTPRAGAIDVPGLVAGAVAVTALTFAVIKGESAGFARLVDRGALRGRRRSPAVAFVAIERRAPRPGAAARVLPRAAPSAVATAVAFTTSFGLFAVFFFTALYLQVVARFSGGKIALQFLAMAVAIVAAGLISGSWTARRGPRVPMVVGCLAAGGGMFVVDALLKPTVSVGPLAAALALVGFGLGLALVAVTAAVLSLVPAERSGMAASTVNTSRQLGGVLAVAILGAVINARLIDDLDSKLSRSGCRRSSRP